MRYLFILLLFFVVKQENVNAQLKNTLEDFNYEKKKKKKNREVEEPDYDEYILKNGFFLEGIFQAATVNMTNIHYGSPVSLSGGGLGFRLGNRWYFGKMRTYRPGIGAVWGRVNLILLRKGQGQLGFHPHVAIAPANLSFVNAFSFGGKLGLEVNLNFGLNLTADLSNYDSVIGYLINPTIKFRYKYLTVGLDVAIMAGDYIQNKDSKYQATLIGLSLGGKF